MTKQTEGTENADVRPEKLVWPRPDTSHLPKDPDDEVEHYEPFE